MGIVVRQSIKSSVGYYLGVGLGAINTLYFSTKFLDTNQLATSRLLLENGLVFAAFAHLGTPNICDRYLAKYKDKENQHHGFLLFLLVFGFLGFIIFTGFFLTFSDYLREYYVQKSPEISQNLWLCIPITLIWTYILVLETYIRGHQRIAIPTFLKETVFRLLNIILIIMLGNKLINFQQFLLLFVGIMFVILLSLVIYTWKLGVLYINPSFLKIDRSDLKTMLGYGSFLILGSVGVNIVYFIDRNILASEIGATATSIFIIATYLSSVIEMPGKSIRLISAPLLAQSVIRKEPEKTKELYGKVAINSMLAGGLLLVLIFANLESLLSIMPKAEIYKQGFWVVIILGTCKWIEVSLGLNAELIAYSKYYKFNTYLVLVLAVLAIFLNYLLIPYFGLIGSAFATGLITLLSSTCKLFVVHQKFQIHPFSSNTVKAVGISVICLLLGMLIPNYAESVLLKLIIIAIKSAIIISVFFLIVVKLNVSEDLTNLYKSVIGRLNHQWKSK